MEGTADADNATDFQMQEQLIHRDGAETLNFLSFLWKGKCALARISSNSKLQTCPLVREDATKQQPANV
jgi:hypothetical protein